VPCLTQGDTQPDLDAAVESAARLCDADDAQVWLIDADSPRLVADHSGLARASCRTELSLPLLRDGTPIGRLLALRVDERPFTERESELLRLLAGSVSSSLENARLRAELGDREGQLEEALQQLSATADVLGAMSRTDVDLRGVFETILDKACHGGGATSIR
jgi:GAF domain-containing protein